MESNRPQRRSNAKIVVKPQALLKQAEELAQVSEPQKSGRKSLPDGKKATHRITLLLNDDELEKFTKKAGIIANGTYLKHIIVTETDLLD